MDLYFKYYLSSTCLETIYLYIGWYHLRNTKYVPDDIWKTMSDIFCEDVDFRNEFSKFKHPNLAWSCKDWILCYINTLISVLPQNLPRIMLNNRDFILLWLKHNSHVKMTGIGDHLMYQHDIMLEFINNNTENLLIMKPELKNDKNFIMAVMKRVGYALEYVPEPLNEDRDIVMSAVTNYGPAIQYVNSVLLSDYDFVCKLVKASPSAFRLANDKIRSDPDIILHVIQHSYELFRYVAPQQQNNRNLALRMVEKNPLVIEYLNNDLKSNAEIMLAAVKRIPGMLNFAPSKLKDDHVFMLEAIKMNRACSPYVSYRLRHDNNFVSQVIRLDTGIWNSSEWGCGNDADVKKFSKCYFRWHLN